MSSTAPCPAAACGGTAIGSASTSTPRWWRGYSLADPQAVSHRCLAGLILVEEAGGQASDFIADHGLLGKGGVAASAPGLAAEVEGLSGLKLRSR